MGLEQCAMGQRLRANDIFRRFKPEEKHEVRSQQLEGSELERLRARRQMLREMTPEQALQAIHFYQRLNLFEALALAQKEGKILVPNDVHDRILMNADIETIEQLHYSLTWTWTGTLIIYEKPDTPFGEEVVFNSKDPYDDVNCFILFKVPQRFRGLENAALVVEHPDFSVVNLGDNRYELIAAENIHLITHISDGGGWYLTDAKTGIPIGERVPQTLDTRSFLRITNAYIGLLARDEVHCTALAQSRQGVGAAYTMHASLNVALF